MFLWNYISGYSDVQWFAESFFADYQNDIVKPWISKTIREASQMIFCGEEIPNKLLHNFMFGFLSSMPNINWVSAVEFDFFSPAKKSYIKKYNTKKKDISIPKPLIMCNKALT